MVKMMSNLCNYDLSSYPAFAGQVKMLLTFFPLHSHGKKDHSTPPSPPPATNGVEGRGVKGAFLPALLSCKMFHRC